MPNPEVSRGLRSGTQLWLDGYTYTRKRRNSSVWKCSQKKRFKCQGSICTDNEYPFSNAYGFKEHAHPPDEFSKKANSIRLKLRQMIEENPELSIAFAIKEVLKDLSEEEKTKLGSTVSIARDLRRIKSGVKKTKNNLAGDSELNLSSENNLITIEEMDCSSIKNDSLSVDDILSAAPFSQLHKNEKTHNNTEPPVELEECKGLSQAWDGMLNQEKKSGLPIIKVESNTFNIFENTNETNQNRCPVNISQSQDSSSHVFQERNNTIPALPPLHEISTHQILKTYPAARNALGQSGHKNTQERDTGTYATGSTSVDRLHRDCSSVQTLNDSCQNGLSVNNQTIESHRNSGFLLVSHSFVPSQSQWYGWYLFNFLIS